MNSFLRTLTSHGRHAGLGLALAGSLLLTACGGGDNATADASASTSSVPTRSVTTAAVAVIPATPSVTTIAKLSETRVSRTEYDYVFRVTVSAGSLAYHNVSATLTGVGTGTTILDGSVVVGNMAPFSVVTPASDTIKLRVNRTLPFNLAALQWQISGAQPGTLAVWVREAGGASVPGAQVTVNGVTGTTAPDGRLTLPDITAGSEQVVKVKRAGYVSQSVRITPLSGEVLPVNVNMLAVQQESKVSHIEQAQFISSNLLNTQLSWPANAFVDGANAPASGPVTVRLSPWKVNGTDLAAMLGNGQGKDAAGARVDLISAGMMSVEVVDAAGNPLQLAPGKKAVLEMDLPEGYASLNGVILVPGAKIPLWHFDESQGLWIEEGEGEVVEGPNFGQLRVHAEVSHFSTWNWDFKFNAGGTVSVQCVNASSIPVACAVQADVTLPDGSKLTKSSSIPASGATIINMPSQADIAWTAQANGFSGMASSGVGGTVIIPISGVVNTRNFVKCLKDATTSSLPCKVTGFYDLGGGQGILETSVPAEGAYVETGFVTGTIDWSAKAQDAQGTTITLYESTATSGPLDNVILTLIPTQTYTANEYQVSCSTQGNYLGSPPEPLAQCTVQFSVYSNFEEQLWDSTITLPTGQVVNVVAPVLPEIGFGSVSATASGASFSYFLSESLDNNLNGGVLFFDFKDLFGIAS